MLQVSSNFEGTEYSILIKTLNNELENVTIWLNANRLTVNMKKKSLHDISSCQIYNYWTRFWYAK